MNLINFDRLWAFFPLIFRSATDKCTCIWKTSNSFDQHFRSDLKCVYWDTVLNKTLIDKWCVLLLIAGADVAWRSAAGWNHREWFLVLSQFNVRWSLSVNQSLYTWLWIKVGCEQGSSHYWFPERWVGRLYFSSSNTLYPLDNRPIRFYTCFIPVPKHFNVPSKNLCGNLISAGSFRVTQCAGYSLN